MASEVDTGAVRAGIGSRRAAIIADVVASGLAVAVYVDKKRPLEELAPEERIPETLELKDRGRMCRVPVKVIEQGPVELE